MDSPLVPRRSSDAVFLAIAHPVRRRILELVLEHDEMAVSTLREAFPQMSFPGLVQQLNVLRRVGLLSDRREGRMAFVSLTPAPLLEIVEWMNGFDRRMRSRLDALGRYLERSQGKTLAHSPRARLAPKSRTPFTRRARRKRS